MRKWQEKNKMERMVEKTVKFKRMAGKSIKLRKTGNNPLKKSERRGKIEI